MRPIADSEVVLIDAMSINHLAVAGVHNKVISYLGGRITTTDIVASEVLEPRHVTAARQSFIASIRATGEVVDLSPEQLVEAEAMATPQHGAEPQRDLGEMSLIVVGRELDQTCLLVTDDGDGGVVARANAIDVASTARLVVEMHVAGAADQDDWWRLQNRAFNKRNRQAMNTQLLTRAQQLRAAYGW